ncbi:hypothetical protein AAFN85_25195 [Mucilaginibacter sp. CAU 1740]|uniref:hypothetical protein n=1 Tax=Mucilaginibacter sp. CAU 1740 TaxID=3140365 RepID=UPI00325AF237
MKVFLSWSKTRSRRVAELLGEWIPCVIQSIDPWVSSQNIEDGELWFSAIQTQIAQIINGIICLTQENKAEPWILFEAGGLARGLEKNRVYVLLIDLRSEDILLSPLAGFNHTRLDEDGIRKLISVINNRTEKPVAPQHLDKAFAKFWPDFKSQVDVILEETKALEKPEQKSKASAEIQNDIKPLLEEILKNVRSSEKSKFISINRTTLSPDITLTQSDKALHLLQTKRRYVNEIVLYSLKRGIKTSDLPNYRNQIVIDLSLSMDGFDSKIFEEALSEATSL